MRAVGERDGAATQRKAGLLFLPIREKVKGKLPSEEEFELFVWHDELAKLPDKTITALCDPIATWIVDAAPTVQIAEFTRYITPIVWTEIQGVPLRLSLNRTQAPEPFKGEFSHTLMVDGDKGRREEDRFKRIERMCSKKFPKLHTWKTESQAQTVLVLEDQDMQLTNHGLVCEALSEVETTRADKPDIVFMVGTWPRKYWFIWCLRQGDKYWFDLPEDNRFWKFDPETLVDITGR